MWYENARLFVIIVQFIPCKLLDEKCLQHCFFNKNFFFTMRVCVRIIFRRNPYFHHSGRLSVLCYCGCKYIMGNGLTCLRAACHMYVVVWLG